MPGPGNRPTTRGCSAEVLFSSRRELERNLESLTSVLPLASSLRGATGLTLPPGFVELWLETANKKPNSRAAVFLETLESLGALEKSSSGEYSLASDPVRKKGLVLALSGDKRSIEHERSHQEFHSNPEVVRESVSWFRSLPPALAALHTVQLLRIGNPEPIYAFHSANPSDGHHFFNLLGEIQAHRRADDPRFQFSKAEEQLKASTNPDSVERLLAQLRPLTQSLPRVDQGATVTSMQIDQRGELAIDLSNGMGIRVRREGEDFRFRTLRKGQSERNEPMELSLEEGRVILRHAGNDKPVVITFGALQLRNINEDSALGGWSGLVRTALPEGGVADLPTVIPKSGAHAFYMMEGRNYEHTVDPISGLVRNRPVSRVEPQVQRALDREAKQVR